MSKVKPTLPTDLVPWQDHEDSTTASPLISSIGGPFSSSLRGVKESALRTHAVYVKPMKRAVREEFKSERMKSLLCSPYVWWRHPLARILIVWVILVEDFYIYGEDPMNDSHVRANFPVIGHLCGLLTITSAETATLRWLKFSMIFVSMILGFCLGRWFVVRIVRARWKVTSFEGSEGAIATVMIFILSLMLCCVFLYNALIPSEAQALGGHSLEIFLNLGAESLQYRHVNKVFQMLSGSVDLLAILMVMDQVLQDKFWYPEFAVPLKQCWNGCNGWVRIVAFWVVLTTGIATVIVGVNKTGTDPGDFTWRNGLIGGTSEVSRGLLAACIVFTDLFTVAQDWAFPTFRDNLEIEVPKIAGTTLESLRFNWLVRLINRCPSLPDSIRQWMPPASFFQMTFTGKGLTYGPLLAVMLIDLMCAKSQLMYEPSDYGQYVDLRTDRIMVIVDEDYLSLAYSEDGTLKNESMISYAARWNATTGQALSASALTDILTNSRYVESWAKYIGLALALLVIAIFVITMQITNYRLRKGLPVDMLEDNLSSSPPVPEPPMAELSADASSSFSSCCSSSSRSTSSTSQPLSAFACCY